MNITVLCGGPSAERSVSLVSGNAVAAGLTDSGHTVRISDIAPNDLSGLDRPADIVFPVLHGAFGESGELQEILEQRGLAFVGSGSAAARLGMQKQETKRVWNEGGLQTPPSQVLTRETRLKAGDVELPCVVKAPASGSSIDVYICQSRDEAITAVDRVTEAHGSALVEQLIVGTELTIGFLDERTLPAIRIVPAAGFYNFDAKYRDRTTGYFFDLGLSTATVEACYKAAQRAYHLVGCRDLARIDLIVDRDQVPTLLEINTMPGFTPTSLLPKAAKHAGVEFDALVDRLATRAFNRQRATRILSKAS
jgi:D-alanine-D-alanine ligase